MESLDSLECLSEKSLSILEEAKKEFASKGFYEASVDTIAANAGVGKGTVYRHFGDKDSLFFAVFQHSFKTYVESMSRKERKADFKSNLKEMYYEMVEEIYENIGLVKLVFHQFSKMLTEDNHLKSFKAMMFEKEIEIFRKIVICAIENKELRGDLDIAQATFFLWEQSAMIPRNILILQMPKEKAYEHFEFVINTIYEGFKRRD